MNNWILESLKAFISIRGSKPSPLFALPLGLGISRSWFDLRLKALLKVCHFDSSCLTLPVCHEIMKL